MNHVELIEDCYKPMLEGFNIAIDLGEQTKEKIAPEIYSIQSVLRLLIDAASQGNDAAVQIFGDHVQDLLKVLAKKQKESTDGR